MKVKGKDLKSGDEIAVWWTNSQTGLNTDTITKIISYDADKYFPGMFKEGACIAKFSYNRGGMTINNADYFEVLNRKDYCLSDEELSAIEYENDQYFQICVGNIGGATLTDSYAVRIRQLLNYIKELKSV